MFWKIVLIVLLILNGLLVFHFIWGENGLLATMELKKTEQSMEEQLKEVREANLDLSRKIRLLKRDPEYLEKVIRSEMHFVQPGETLYLFPDQREGNRPAQDGQ